MWTIPIPEAAFLPTAPFLVPVPGLGPVLVLVAFAVAAGLVWLISAEVRLQDRRVRCPEDQMACVVVTDRMGRLVVCTPRPEERGIRCEARCLTV